MVDDESDDYYMINSNTMVYVSRKKSDNKRRYLSLCFCFIKDIIIIGV